MWLVCLNRRGDLFLFHQEKNARAWMDYWAQMEGYRDYAHWLSENEDQVWEYGLQLMEIEPEDEEE